MSQPVSGLGVTLVLIFLLVALLGPVLAPYGANEQIPADARQPPSSSHWFGTDHLGRDVFSRVVLGARDILALSGLGTLLAVVAGASLGLVSGYRGGWLDEGLMRLFDSLLAIPAMMLALVFVGVAGPSRGSILIVISLLYTPIVARVVRSVTLSAKTLGYVETARLRGEAQVFILFSEILPSVTPALSVEAAMRFSYAIFLVASLGFLGLGVQPPNPDWGLMIQEARLHVNQLPWTMLFPALAIAWVVIGANLTADGLRRTWMGR
jgi:peptide/nickel transport system permease protein